MKKYIKYFAVSALVVLVDQLVKMWVFHNMQMGYNGEIKLLGNFFKLHYTLNPGLAMGLSLEAFGITNGKLFLTIFRIIAVFAIGYYLYDLITKSSKTGFIWCVTFILGGAIGNVIDSTFYGVWLNNAPIDAPTPWFNGQVIDMFYIDIWEGYLPDWIPILGGTYYSLWPIFNVADASIFLSVIFILIYQKQYFNEDGKIATQSEKSSVPIDSDETTNRTPEEYS